MLDSSAVLAILGSEPGAEVVIAVLPESVISSVNAAEVFRKLASRGPMQAVRSIWNQLELRVHSFGLEDAEMLAAVHNASSHLSLGDCACIALAQRLRLPAMTADKIWGTSRAGVQIRQIRR